MRRREFNQGQAAEYLGWDETYMSMVINGHRALGLKNAILLERRTGIPVEAWVSSELDETESVVAATAANPKIRKR
jgi:plasmid maintenance system antidote protein VapI